MPVRTAIGKHLIMLAAAALVGAVGSASAQSLKEARAQEAEETALDREIAFTRSVCGGALSGSIDWRSAANWPDGVSLVASCDGALGAVEALCRETNGKTRVRAISRFICAGDGAGASLRGGALRYGARPGASGFAETKALLDQAL